MQVKKLVNLHEETMKKKEQNRRDKENQIAYLKEEIVEELKRNPKFDINQLMDQPNDSLNKYIRGKDGVETRRDYRSKHRNTTPSQRFYDRRNDREVHNDRDLERENAQLKKELNNMKLRNEFCGADPNRIFRRNNMECFGHILRDCRFPKKPENLI